MGFKQLLDKKNLALKNNIENEIFTNLNVFIICQLVAARLQSFFHLVK
jgi:hypothetical protein